MDDLLIVIQINKEIKAIANQLKNRFKLKSISKVRTFLGYILLEIGTKERFSYHNSDTYK